MEYTIINFYKEFTAINKETPSYRVGQHFCNLFIKDSSTEEMCKLYNEENIKEGWVLIDNLINSWDWDYLDLPLLDVVLPLEDINE